MKKILHIAVIVLVLMSAGVIFGCDDGGGMETEPMPEQQTPQEKEETEEQSEETEQGTEALPELPAD